MSRGDRITTPTPLRFRRFECKYVISASLAERVRSHLLPFVAPDPYAANSPDGAYNIYSLYLDSPDLRLFRETEEGLSKRIKLRIRHYGLSAGHDAFLEIKRRHDRLVLKGRARMGGQDVARMLAGEAVDTSSYTSEEQACCEEFMSWMARWGARPVVWVGYRREAYVGIYHDSVRVTFDRNLACAPCELGAGWAQAEGEALWCPVETGRVILELKFDSSCPEWLSNLVQRFELERRSYSKYSRSVMHSRATSAVSPRDAVLSDLLGDTRGGVTP